MLLLGSGHYDYRGINTKLGPNYMPPYEKESVASDDFFGALDPGELILYGKYDLDVAVGRLPVSTEQELSHYMDKVREYEKVGLYDHSEWRSTLLLAADDALNSHIVDYTEHTKLQEMLARSIDSMATAQNHQWNQKKMYLLDYPADASGQKKDAVDDFINMINQGALITAYFGHGSMTDWASEGLLKPSYIAKISNRGRLTILNSFSCTVGRFDMGNARSLSEEFVLASQVGSIASIGSTRETFADYNEAFGRAFLISLLKTEGMLVGDAYRNAKNSVGVGYSRQRYNNELYVLIGEPVLQMPKASMKVSFDAEMDTLKALDKVRLSGNVSGMKDGYIGISLHEGKRSKRLFNGLDVEDDTVDVVFDGSLIHSQVVPVRGGRFETEFISPRKLSFGDTAARLSAWAYSSKDKSVGRFLKRKILISGVSAFADSINDQTPPSIQVQTCYSRGVNTSFADGESVKMQFPACLQVTIEDSTAIDFREQPDEGISFEIVGVEHPYHPGPFLEQTSKKVVVRKTFNAENYPEGKYVFKVRAQDVLGNVAVKTLNLELTEEIVDRKGHGPFFRRIQEIQRHDKFIPRIQEAQYAGCHHGGLQQRKHDLEIQAPGAAAVDDGRFIQIYQNLRDEAVDQKDGERRLQGGIQENDSQTRIVELGDLHDFHQCYIVDGDDHSQNDVHVQCRKTFCPSAREDVGRHGRGEDGEERCEPGVYETVDKAHAQLAFFDDGPEIAEDPLRWEFEAHAQGFFVRLEGGDDDQCHRYDLQQGEHPCKHIFDNIDRYFLSLHQPSTTSSLVRILTIK